MSNNYPMCKEDEQEEALLWVVDVWMADDYRAQDAFFFKSEDEAKKFAKWTVETDQPWLWPGNSIYPICKSQVKTLEENTKIFLERYGLEEDDE
jgi:hypothetical protein